MAEAGTGKVEETGASYASSAAQPGSGGGGIGSPVKTNDAGRVRRAGTTEASSSGGGGAADFFRPRAGSDSRAGVLGKISASMTRTRYKSGEGQALQPGQSPGVVQTVHGTSPSAAEASASSSAAKKSVFDIFPKNFRPRSKSDAAGKTKRPKGGPSAGEGGRHSGSTTPRGGAGGALTDSSRSPPATPGVGQPAGGPFSSHYTTYHGGMFGSGGGSQRSQKSPHLRELFADPRALLARDRSSRLSLHGFSERFELENVADNQVFVKFMKSHRCHDVIPDGYNNKLVVFDTRLKVQKAFFALMEHNVRAAPLWDSAKQDFVGMLTISDFITILQKYYRSPLSSKDDIKCHLISTWRDVLKNHNERIAANKLVYIGPDASLYEAVKKLHESKIHRLAVMDAWSGNVIQIITHKRLLRFLFQFNHELPRPAFVFKSIEELGVGTFNDIVTVNPETPLINALNKFCKYRVSSLPVIDRETEKLIDIYAKYDTIKLASNQSYNNLDITVRQALQFGNVKGVGGPYTCRKEESLQKVMERIVRCNVHRLVVVDSQGRVAGIVSLSDILHFIVLHQETVKDDGAAAAAATTGETDAAANAAVESSQSATAPTAGEVLKSPSKSPSPTKRPPLKLFVPPPQSKQQQKKQRNGAAVTPPPLLARSPEAAPLSSAAPQLFSPRGMEKTPSPLREAPPASKMPGAIKTKTALRKKSIVDEIIPEFPSAIDLNVPELV